LAKLPKFKYGIITDSVISIVIIKKYKHRGSVTMPTTIVDYNKGITSFLQDVNYGMSKPQFNHLCKFEAKITGRSIAPSEKLQT
jgi:hypothetical protein